MGLQMTIKQFEELNLFSNRNVEKVAASVINESSNAALVSMFEDSMILLDHEDGQFYAADYKFDGEKLTLTLENFQPIELEKENVDFKGSVKNFFESEDSSVGELAESYRESVIEQEKFINDLVSEALSTKDFDNAINYKELAEANNDISIKDKEFFKSYVERLDTHPLTEAVFFNWDDKMVVSLVETERVNLINSSAAEKAQELWKKENFKKAFTEASSVFIEDVEAGKELFVSLFEEYPSIFLLDAADRKTLFGKAVISNSTLRESLDDLQKGISILFEDDDLVSLKESYLLEMDDEETGEEEEGDDEEAGDDEPAKELEPEEIQSLVDELKKVAEKIEDEKLKEKMDDIIGKLDTSVEEGTRPNLVKEAVKLLII